MNINTKNLQPWNMWTPLNKMPKGKKPVPSWFMPKFEQYKKELAEYGIHVLRASWRRSGNDGEMFYLEPRRQISKMLAKLPFQSAVKDLSDIPFVVLPDFYLYYNDQNPDCISLLKSTPLNTLKWTRIMNRVAKEVFGDKLVSIDSAAINVSRV